MKKIATHNSCTGEPSKGVLSWLVLPFARCQGRTLYQQFMRGCRLFDLRFRLTEDGVYRPAHGLWVSKTSGHEVLAELDRLAAQNQAQPTYVMVTYEGRCEYPAGFVTAVHSWMSRYPHLTFTEIAVKKPVWKVLEVANKVPFKQAFKALNRHNWQVLLPIPKLWQLVYQRHPTYKEDSFTMVDFL